MSLSHKDNPVMQVLRLTDGTKVQGNILSFLDGEFLVLVPKSEGYDRRRIPFTDVDVVTNQPRSHGGGQHAH
jgi:hypothetical protein